MLMHYLDYPVHNVEGTLMSQKTQETSLEQFLKKTLPHSFVKDQLLNFVSISGKTSVFASF